MNDPDFKRMKKAKVKTDLEKRAALRANQQRRLDHAQATLMELLTLHDVDERDIAELHIICARLKVEIQNQHIKDERYAQYKKQALDTSTLQGY